jgi:N-acetylglucosamine-6-phosphate deacetylase
MFEDGDRDGVRRIRATLAAHGTTALLATIAALPPGTLARAVATATAAMIEPGGARILGIHLEGPFSTRAAARSERRDARSVDRGARPPAGYRRRRDSLLTLAPELPGALEVIRHARGQGITVALGHSEASAAQVEAAIAAGATHVTHCFNAMAPLHHREVGLAGVALTDDRLRIELIADGVHVDRRAIALAVRSKARGGWMLVSDGVAAVGQPAGPLTLFGAACIAGDAVRQADTGASPGVASRSLRRRAISRVAAGARGRGHPRCGRRRCRRGGRLRRSLWPHRRGSPGRPRRARSRLAVARRGGRGEAVSAVDTSPRMHADNLPITHKNRLST